jgi:aminoglycoside 6'-N-acetyltransferase I
MEILPITLNNLDDCIKVFISAYNQAPWNYSWTFDQAKQYLSEYLDSKYFIGFILYENKKAVGAVFAHSKTWWTNQQLMIDEFYIANGNQRKGYGKMLMEHCDQYARENEIEQLILMTHKYMPAFKFYENIDYIAAEQYVFMFKQLV